MRIRKKKHLDDRLECAGKYLLVADNDILNAQLANKQKKYLNFFTIFGNGNLVELEIGCGKGAFIIEKAKRNKNINYIAVELLQNIIVMAVENAIKENIGNVLFFNCGADYLARYISPHSINAIYLNFSPPYPGKRYENRRLTKDSLIKFYKDILTDDGAIYQKTDDKDFFDFSKQKLIENGFSVSETNLENAPENIKTEYERKFTEKGIPVYALIAKSNS